MADRREHVTFKATYDARGIFGDPGEDAGFEPLAGNFLEAAPLARRRGRRFLPPFLRRVETKSKLMLHLVAPGAGCDERGLGEAPAREEPVLAVIPIGKAPELRAIGLDENEEAAAVRFLICFAAWLQQIGRAHV